MTPYKDKQKRIENDRKRYHRNKEVIKRKNRNYYHKNREAIRKRRLELAPKHRQKRNQAMREYYARLRKEVVLAYGGKCICCGEKEFLFLELDHIKNDGWKRKDKSAATLYRQAKKKGFPKGEYQLLCANCNQGKRRNGGICPHKKKSQ